MIKVTARQLPQTDLSIGFAVEQADGKIKQYFVGWATALRKDSTDVMSAAKLTLESYLSKEMGDKVWVELLNPVTIQESPFTGYRPESKSDGAIRTEQIPESFFDPKNIKDLKKVQAKGHTYEYNHNESIFPIAVANIIDAVTSPIKRFINDYIIGPINKRLHTFHGLDPVYSKIMDIEDRFEYLNALEKYDETKKNFFFIPYLLIGLFTRRAAPTSYLVVACEEDDLSQAIQSVDDDLTILRNNKLIMGHLAMPGIIDLANMAGNGKRAFAVFVYYILDTVQLAKVTKTPLINLSNQRALKDLGIINDVYEGGVNYFNGKAPYEDLVIAKIDMSAEVTEQQNKADLDEMGRVYQEQQEFIKRKKEQRRKEAEALAAKEKNNK